MNIPILSIVGKSSSGKTCLIEKLIAELKARGYRVGSVKHHAHSGFDIDHPGKDSWRHAQAGSDHVIIASPDKIASIERIDQEMSLDEIIPRMSGVDIILTEGFLRAGKPALEVVHAGRNMDLICQPPQLLAVASDTKIDVTIPQFHRDDAGGIVDFIERNLIKKEGH